MPSQNRYLIVVLKAVLQGLAGEAAVVNEHEDDHAQRERQCLAIRLGRHKQH